MIADPNFRTSESGITPLTMAASLPRADLVSALLKAGARPNTQDTAERTPLQYATMASDLQCMVQLLEYKAEADDESLHIAARQVNFAAVNLLLDYHARTDLPGTIHCGGRTPLGEICHMADLTRNPSELEKTLALLCEATADLRVLTHHKSLIIHALDNYSPIKMATALLTTSPFIRAGLNGDFNICALGSLRYSPTAYVRHFKCVETHSHRNIDFSRRCCKNQGCPAPKLENLLHAYGCKDRFWDALAGANQPEGSCDPPSTIVTAIEDAEATRREEARKIQRRRELEAAAAAERAKEQERRIRQDEERAADLRALEQRAAAEARAIQQQAEAEEKARRLQAETEAKQAEAKRRREQIVYDERRERKRRESNEEGERERRSNERALKALKDRTNTQIDQKKKEAEYRKSVLKEEKSVAAEKRKMMNEATNMFREAGYAGVGTTGIGRVLGEIEQ